jgi:hypothetical protein
MRKFVREILGRFCPEISAEGLEGVVKLPPTVPQVENPAVNPHDEQSPEDDHSCGKQTPLFRAGKN